jgi:hypothetical protein
MSGLYNPKVGDRIRFNLEYGNTGTVKEVVLKDARHSGSVKVLFDGRALMTNVHRRSLKLVKRAGRAK